MNFLIKIADDNLRNVIQYEKELIRSVALMNLLFIETHEHEFNTFCLKCLGIRYEDYLPEFDCGLEIDHISQMLERGFGKCDSIVAWYMAAFLKDGIESEPVIIKNGKDSYHVLLLLKENNQSRILDPSKNLDAFSKEFCGEC